MLEAELERVRTDAQQPNNGNNKSGSAIDDKSASVKTEEQHPKAEPAPSDNKPKAPEMANAAQSQHSSNPNPTLKVEPKSERDSLLCTTDKPTQDSVSNAKAAKESSEAPQKTDAKEPEAMEKEQLLTLAAELGCRNPPRQCKTRASAAAAAHATPEPPTRTSSRRSRAADRASTPPARADEDSATARSQTTGSRSRNKRGKSSTSSKSGKRRSRSSHSKKGTEPKREKKVPLI